MQPHDHTYQNKPVPFWLVLTMSGRAGIIEQVFDKNMCLMGGRVGHERHTYICIDLKTFYASVECVDRGLDPLTTNLVVADESRGRTTICLAITQAMKDLGIHNRCRLFEIPDGIDYIKAVPRMQHYMEVSAQIYGIYLEFVSPQDVHVYSIDECFIDVTPYLDLYHTDAELRLHVARRGPGAHRHHGNGWHRPQPIPGQGGTRHYRQARTQPHRHTR